MPKKGEALVHTNASCTAKTRDGDLCKNPPMLGSRTCRMHGSSTEAARAKAQERILAAADMAATRLIEFMNSSKVPFPVRLQAARDLLDRAGLKAGMEVTVKLAKFEEDFAGLFIDTADVVDGEVVEERDTFGPADRTFLNQYTAIGD